MKKKPHYLAPGVIERYPRRRIDCTGFVMNTLMVAVACVLTTAAASIGWLLGGVL